MPKIMRITVEDKDIWSETTLRYEVHDVVCPLELPDIPAKFNDMIFNDWRISIQQKVRTYCRKHGDNLENVEKALQMLGVEHGEIITYIGDFPKKAPKPAASITKLIERVREGIATEEEKAKVKAFIESNKDILSKL